MAALGKWRVDRARDCEYFASLVRSTARRDERAGFKRCLHHEAAARETADEAVTPREIVCDCCDPERKFGKQQAARSYFSRKLGIARRVNHVDPSAKHRDGRGAACQAAAVRSGVDAEGKPGDDRQSGFAQRKRELLGIPGTLCRGVSAADDRNRRLLEEIDPATRIEHGRRIADLQERARVSVVRQGDDKVILLACPLQSTLDGLPYAS